MYNDLPINNPKAVKMLTSLIEEIVDNKIKNILRIFMVGTVTNVSGGKLDVLLDDGSTTELTGILDRTNQAPGIGDQVYILKINGSSNNLVALIKK